MFETKMNMWNDIKKALGMACCIEEKYFGTDKESAERYFDEMCTRWPEPHYDVVLQKNMAFKRYRVFVMTKGWA